ncbi:DUF2474 family protein [Caenibius tardaugens NBRC 16725]|nr:DUF2474 family protein [Caenibius tardaugens NBRC 16725]
MRLLLSRLGWFAGIWSASVLGLALVGALIRWWLR